MRKSPVVLQSIDVPVQGLSPKLSGLRIAHVTDFHFRCWNRVLDCAQRLLLSTEYDFLVATGDFTTQPSKWTEAARLVKRFFEPLAERTPCFAVLGNHDHPAMAADHATPLDFLCNESVLIDRGGESVVIAGVDQSWRHRGNLEAALDTVTDGCLSVLLAHYPSTVFRLPRGKVDLQLSGHTHGGQIRLPWVGCLWTNDRISRSLARGLHEVSGVSLHTSTGIGVSMPLPVRINCPPEVVILTVQSVGGQRPTESRALVPASLAR